MMTYRTAEFLMLTAVACVIGPMFVGLVGAFWFGSGALLVGMTFALVGLVPFALLLVLSEWVMGKATR